MSALLEARDVGKRFPDGTADGVRALDGVTLSIERGAFTLVEGPSGSGKTTLLAILGTLERPTAGAVAVDGVDPAGLGEAGRSLLRRRFGFAFPGGALVPRLPLWENVTLGLVPRGHAVADRRDRAAALLERVGLTAKLRAPGETLSSGELQRALVARALVGDPEILVVDEPLANLDPSARDRLVALLREFHVGGGTVLATSHVDGAFPFATTTFRLEAGHLAG